MVSQGARSMTGHRSARLGTRIAISAGMLSVIAGLGCSNSVAAHAGSGPSDPTVTCATDPNIFNTGYEVASGGVDANWEVAGPYDSPAGTTPETATYLPAANPDPPATPTFALANVNNLVPGAWAATPYSNAQWISQQTIANPTSPNGDWYYEYNFNLAPSVLASSFSLDMNFMSDNDLATVFVNNVDQSTYPGSNLPQNGTDPYNYQGYHLDKASQTTLDHNWKNGPNTIIVEIKSGPPEQGFDAQIRPSAFCNVNLAVTKTASPDPYTPGQLLTYTVTVTNGGPGYAAEATVSDPLPAALAGGGFTWTCSASSGSSCTPSGSGNISDSVGIAAGGSLVYTVSGVVPIAASGTLTNSVTVAPPAGASDPGCSPNCTVTNHDPQAAPTLTVSKSVTSTGPYTAVGQIIAYQFVVTNTGNVTLTSVSVADTQTAPAGPLTSDPTCESLATPSGTCAGATTTLAPGQAATFTATYTITQADLDNGSVRDTATASGDPPGCSSSGCASTSAGSGLRVALTQAPALTVVKSSPTPSYSAVGDTIAYGFLVTNTGNVTLSNIAVNDTETAPATQANLSPITCPDSTLAPAAAETCAATYTVTAADMLNGSVSDTATASGTPPGSVTPVTSGSSGTTVNAYFAVVTLTKSATTTTPTVGSHDTFTLTAANAGPSDSGQVLVTDVLPNGLGFVSSTPSNCVSSCVGVAAQTVTWTISDLAPGSNATLQIVTLVSTSSNVTNSASFMQTAPNGSGGNSGSSNTVAIDPSWADVTVTKAATITTLQVGNTDTFTLTATNAGGSTSSSGQVVVTDVLPIGLSYQSSTASNCVSNCVLVMGQTVTWTITDLSAGADTTLQVVVKGTAPGAILNTASFTQAVPNDAGSSAGTSNTVGVNVVGPPDLAIKFGTTALTLGQTTTVRYTITNPGDNPVSLTGVGFTDHVAAILRVANPANATTTCSGGSVAAPFGGSTVILSGATLGVGQSCTVTVNVVAVATGTGTESATVTSTNGGVGETVHVDVLAAIAPAPPNTGASSSGRWATVGLLIVGALLVFAFGILRRRHRMSGSG